MHTVVATLALFLGCALPGTVRVARAQPIDVLGVAGDSLSDEYDAIGFHFARSWTQILVGMRGISMGPSAAELGMASWGDLRGSGFEFNYARPGATTDALILEQSPQHLAYAVQNFGVTHVVIAASGNDMASWNNFAYLNMYYNNWTQRRMDAYADTSIANVREAVRTVHDSGAKIVLLNMPDFNFMPFYHTNFPDAASRARSTGVVHRVNAGLRQVAEEFHIPLVDLDGLNRAIFGPDDALRATLNIGGATVMLQEPDLDGAHPLTGFLNDSVHLNTIMQAVWANAIITALNAGYHTEIAVISEPEMLSMVGVSVDSPQDGRIGEVIGPYGRYVVAGACPADYNGSGALEVQDIFDFVNGWLGGNARADFDGSGGLNVSDIFAFLNSWMAGGC